MARFRRPMQRKRRTTRKRTTRNLRKRNLSRQIHNFKRTFYVGTYTASISALGVATPIAQGLQFNLNQLPSSGEFQSLYDQYKINGVKLKITPATSEGILSPLAGTAQPLGFSPLHTVLDFDDATVPTSEDQLLEYGSHKQTAPFRSHTRYFKPKCAMQVYRSATSTAYRPISSQWLDMSYVDVPHYGVKVWASAPNTNSGTAQSITYKVYATLYFACKNTR